MTTPADNDSIEYAPIDKLSGRGEASDNVARLAELFPDAVTDGRVDLEALRGLLGEDAEPAGGETSGLRWAGMAEARRLSTLPATGTLLPRPDESVHWDSTRNIVIEGDNLEVLRLLRRGYTNKVDVIYIDPPYNTTNDFVYDDSRVSTVSEHEADAGLRDAEGATQVGAGSDRAVERRLASARHAKWLSMMYPRLLVAHSLLKETGVLIAAIDDNEHSRLKLLLDRVFGAENFAANVVWQGVGKNDARFTSGGVDYMLIYAKNKARLVEGDVRWSEPKRGYDDVVTAAGEAWNAANGDASVATASFKRWLRQKPDIEKGLAAYSEIDETGELFTRSPISSPNPRPNLMYDVLHPETLLPVPTPANGWRYSKEVMAEKIAQGRVLFGVDHTSTVRYKRYLREVETQAIRPVFFQVRSTASDRLEELLESDVFSFPKDPSVVANWLRAVTEDRRDVLVLDFFAGSGSTGQAVMELNAADGGSRRYMLVQLDEEVGKDGYDTIADITRERLRRAGQKIAENLPLESAAIDLGFRSYRLGSSNLKPWDGTGQLNLVESVDNLVEGRSTDDLLVEMMLRLGIELTTPVEAREVGGSTLYNLGGGTLYAYFGDHVTTQQSIEVARALVQWRDENPVDSDVTMVVRDTGFVDSSAKLNLDAAVKQAGFTTFRSI
ncbi:adenine-specific DNA-methyltransferase [Microbacterium sp. LKL04]|uniref:site-specific DNA-methyltransferase n=1 Tax=Microbacterium sp. LKL04 TaxID=912630 RepID=UPI000875C7C2|nr:site-specific DNA-methyltransferase [Microbacterium sp. LKL04]SCY35137.1 adenine-specific DNA-methyltransferase [Microbacterium sp. LKL04]